MDKLLVMCVVMIGLKGYFGYVQGYCEQDSGEHCEEFCENNGTVQLSCAGENGIINLIMGKHYGPCKPNDCNKSCAIGLKECIYMNDANKDGNWNELVGSCQNKSQCNVTHKRLKMEGRISECCTGGNGMCGKQDYTQVTAITWKCTSSATTTTPDKTTSNILTSTTTVDTSTESTERSTADQTSDYTTESKQPTTHLDTTTTVTTSTLSIAPSTTAHVTSSQPPEVTTEEDKNGGDSYNLHVIVGAAAGTAVVVLVVVVVCCYCRKRSPPSKSTSDDVSNREMSLSKSKIVDTDQNVGVKHYTPDSGEQYAMVNKSQTPSSEFGAQPDIQRVSSKPDLLPDTEVYYNTRDSVKNSTAVSNEEGVVEDYYGVSQPTDPSLIEQAQRFQAADVTMDSLDPDVDMFGLNIGGGGMMDDDYDYTRHDVRVLQKVRNEARGEDNEDYAVPDVPTITTTDPLKSDSIGHMEEGDDYAYVYGHMGTNGPIIKQGGHVISGRPVIGSGAGGQEHMNSGTLSAAVHNAKGGKDVPNDYSLEAPVYALSSKTKPLTDGTETVMKENELYG